MGAVWALGAHAVGVVAGVVQQAQAQRWRSHAAGIAQQRLGIAEPGDGDDDGDGWTDLYVIRGTIGPNLLYRNRGDGTFEDVAATVADQSIVAAGSVEAIAGFAQQA